MCTGKKLFIVSTQYQMFNVLNICNNIGVVKDTIDLVILDFGTNIYSKLNINLLNLFFNKVYIHKIKVPRRKLVKNISLALQIIFQGRFGIQNKRKYEEIYIAGTESYSKALAFSMGRKGFKLYYYEEGVGSYTQILDKDLKKKQEFLFQLRYGITPIKRCSRVYLYNPAFVMCNTADKTVCKISSNRSMQKKWIDIFKGEHESIEHRFIFFGQWYESAREYGFQNVLIKALMEVISREDCCIKLHPSRMEEQISYLENNIEKVSSNSSSFEVVNHYHDMRDKVLISVTSTAVSSPKLIYDEEPFVIYCFKIFADLKHEKASENTLGVVEKLKHIYKEDKVFIPESIEEFKQILSVLRDEKLQLYRSVE